MQEWAEVAVEFLPPEKGGRQSPPSLRGGLYRPHFRVGEKGEYLGVAFVDGPGQLAFGQIAKAVVVLIYCDDNFDYEPLGDGACFEVMEGPHVVGHGRVIRRFKSDEDWRVRPDGGPIQL